MINELNYMVKTAAATNAPNSATVDERWMAPALSAVSVALCVGPVTLGCVMLLVGVWVSLPCARTTEQIGPKRQRGRRQRGETSLRQTF